LLGQRPCAKFPLQVHHLAAGRDFGRHASPSAKLSQ
jgi:hypothetical protein